MTLNKAIWANALIACDTKVGLLEVIVFIAHLSLAKESGNDMLHGSTSHELTFNDSLLTLGAPILVKLGLAYGAEDHRAVRTHQDIFYDQLVAYATQATCVALLNVFAFLYRLLFISSFQFFDHNFSVL